MPTINEVHPKPERPETIIQFGEGGFLRGFADWMLQKLNDSGCYTGSVVVVQPIAHGMCDKLVAQNCVYTHIMRGMDDGAPVIRKDIVDVISRCVNPYTDYAAFLALAKEPSFRFIISNTTEAGIVYEPFDAISDAPPKSFPAKLTALLYERFQAGLPGFILLPCELIERNGDKLRKIVLQYASEWALGDAFTEWIATQNHFCNTLVDRIVTGYPKEEDMGLPYEDAMCDTSEVFHLWVIEGDQTLARELPFSDVGLNVLWTDDLNRYRTRKVRILNGAHTSLVPYAMLRGFDTVKACVDDPDMLAFLRRCIFDEIIPTLDLPKEELRSYAEDVLARFANPYIKHYLSSIALNSVSKFRVRVLPSILTYIERFGKMPPTLLKAFAALLQFYKTDMANDDPDVMTFLKKADVPAALANADLWGQDLSFLTDEVMRYANSSH